MIPLHQPLASSATQTFPGFSSLPLELRRQIWLQALPPRLGATLYIFRPRYWAFGTLTPSDEGFNPDNRKWNECIEFQHDKMDDDPITFPSLTAVNHESREMALSWLQNNDIKYPSLRRTFDLSRDAIYISPGELDDFWNPFDRRRQDLGEYALILPQKILVRHVAVPEIIARYHAPTLVHGLYWIRQHLETLLVVVDAPEGLVDVIDSGRDRPWEFERLDGASLVWDAQSEQYKVAGEVKSGYRVQCNQVLEAFLGVSQHPQWLEFRPFEIRFVQAMPRGVSEYTIL
ncbi:hypothetical protein ANO11243_049210 [Dothideomycetidae sp. 11243]|nr:hypothetical protein ANO11243_049210 [fungal sp. No.11243]